MLARRLAACLLAFAPCALALAAEPKVDYREQMRLLVEHVAAEARAHDPEFVVVVQDGLDLLVKPGSDELPAPASAYRKALDGVLVRDLVCRPTPGSDGLDEDAERRLMLARAAREHGLQVFVIAGGGTAGCRRLDFVPVATAEIGPSPRSLSRPRGESAANIAAPVAVKNAAAVARPEAFGTVDDFLAAMRATNHDLVVVDLFHGRRALEGRAVRALQFKALGARRLVLARVDIATAARWQYYWQPEWMVLPPPWLGPPLTQDPDRRVVRYWFPEWRHIIADGERSLIKGIVSLGYDGVLLTGLEAYRIFEGSGRPLLP